MTDVLLTLISIGVGALVTGFVAKYYYERASKDLKTEAAALRKMVNTIGRAMQSEGLVEFGFDENGELSGVVHKLSGTGRGTSHASAKEISVERAPRR